MTRDDHPLAGERITHESEGKQKKKKNNRFSSFVITTQREKGCIYDYHRLLRNDTNFIRERKEPFLSAHRLLTVT